MEERPENAARDFIGTRNQTIGLFHGHHHGAEVVRLDHGFAGLLFLDALAATQQQEPANEAVEVRALRRIDQADAFERDIEGGGGLLDSQSVAQQNRSPEAQGEELAGRLDDPGFGAFGKDDPLGVTLELLDDAANETHGRTMAEPPTSDKDGVGSL